MVLGIGGAAQGGQDTYFFTGDKVVDTDLSNYYNKEQINALLKEINDKFDKYYTKDEIDDLIENIDIDYDAFYTKEDIDNKIEDINNNINNVSTNISTFETTLNEINENVTNIENTYVSNDTFNEYKNVIENTYVTNETLVTEVTQIIVENPSTGEAISEQVTIAVDEKVAELVEDNKIITSDNVTTIVVQEVERAIKEQGDYDGGNEEDWPSPDEIESTDTPATPGEDGGEEESW
jgi:ABC-type transporter Mla subunit MlaD